MKFKGKTDILYYIGCLLMLGVFIITSINAKSLILFIFYAFIFLVIFSTFFSNYIIIDEKFMKIRMGIFYREIEMDNITKIRAPKGHEKYFSNGVTSFDRLIVHYDKLKVTNIAVCDKDKFIERAKEINPKIEILLN